MVNTEQLQSGTVVFDLLFVQKLILEILHKEAAKKSTKLREHEKSVVNFWVKMVQGCKIMKC